VPYTGDMRLESKKRLTIQERTYRALADIAKATRKEEVDEEIVTDAVLNWTIDPVHRTDDGFLEADKNQNEDLTTLFSYVVNHLNGQRVVEDALDQAKVIAEKMSSLDTAKLSAQDPEEWDKLQKIMDDQTAPDVEVPDTLEDLFAQIGEEAPEEGSADEVVKEALVHRVDSQAKAAQLLAFFLEAVYADNDEVVHGVINQYQCVLVHMLCSLLLSWVQSRSTLPEGTSLPEWFNDLRAMGQKAESLSDEEKIELGEHYLRHNDDED
jgi:hypothetical protein